MLCCLHAGYPGPTQFRDCPWTACCLIHSSAWTIEVGYIQQEWKQCQHPWDLISMRKKFTVANSTEQKQLWDSPGRLQTKNSMTYTHDLNTCKIYFDWCGVVCPVDSNIATLFHGDSYQTWRQINVSQLTCSSRSSPSCRNRNIATMFLSWQLLLWHLFSLSNSTVTGNGLQ